MRVSQTRELEAPFSYFLKSSDVVGFRDCPEGFQLVNDGTLISSFGTVSFAVGAKPSSFDARVKTLLHGSLPMPQWSVRRHGIDYHFLTWGLPANLDPREDLIAYVQIEMTNTGHESEKAGLNVGFTPIEETDAPRWPCVDWYRARFMSSDEGLESGTFKLKDGVLYCDGHAVLASDTAPGQGDGPGTLEFGLTLEPGEHRRILLKIPYVPIATEHAQEIERLSTPDGEASLANAIQFWDKLIGGVMQVDLPEDKVVQTLRTSLAYILIARDVDETGNGFVQKVNEFQYDHFYPRDTAYLVRAYDMWGLHDVAKQNLESFLIRDASGAITQIRRYPNHPDDWGQSLWALGAHIRATADLDFARQLPAAIALHLDDFERSVGGDPLGLWPVAKPYDNELINGHYTGHNFWALLGLRAAETIAHMASDDALARRARALHDDFRKTVMQRLEYLTAQTEGYIPPGMDDPMAGYDWANASGGVYPFGVLAPDDPWAQATISTAREYKWREGISTYGPNAWALKKQAREGADVAPGYLHHYETYNITEALLAMGRQEEVIEDLYSILVHTSSTNAGFEFSIMPWDDRDPKGNYPPHGWFAARTCELVRNMLVREVGDTLHLASALSPRWLRDGDRISVSNAPTNFGVVSYQIDVTENGADVRFRPTWLGAPAKVVFHIPWFLELEEARTEQGKLALKDDSLELPLSACEFHLQWKRLAHADLSYERGVHLWLEKAYTPQPETDLAFLFPRPTRPKLKDWRRIFADGYLIELLSPNPAAQICYTLDGTTPTAESARYTTPVTIREQSRLQAIEVWPDGRASEPLAVLLRKVPMREAVAVDGAKPGLQFAVYPGQYDKLPDFATLRPKETRSVRDLDLKSTGMEDDYAAVFDGLISIPTDGVYRFTLGSDDGSRLWIDGHLLVDHDGLHAYSEKSGDDALEAGLHAIRVEYFERGGASWLRLFMRGADGTLTTPGPGSFFHRPDAS